MKQSLIVILLIATLSIFISVAAEGSDKVKREVGKVLFKSVTTGEVLVLSTLENPSFVITKGSVLETGEGDDSVKLSVTDICGLYIRCSSSSLEGGSARGIKEGEKVFLSVEGNEFVKYSDVKIVLSALIKLYEDFIYKIESVDEPVVISDYMEKFASDLEKMIPEMERLNARYPELKKFYVEPPRELKSEAETLKLLEPALKNIFFKIHIYEEDPAVKRAIEKLNDVLKRMNGTGK